MRATRRVTLFHAPQSRSSGVLALLEELGADYQLQVLDLKAGQQREPAFLAINPLGKVPVIRQGEGEQAAVVTEQVAIYLHLADLYPEAGLAPQLDDPLRGPYLRWMSFYGSCLEPAIIDRSLQRDPAAYSTSPYGDFDTVLGAIRGQLARGPYFLGERFTAAEVRRASYWSLLVTPPAGVTYGHFSLWAWANTPELVGDAIRNQPEYTLEPWWSVLDTPGVRSMTLLRHYFASGPWWNLRPAQALLTTQPGDQDARTFIAAARTRAGEWTVVYLPVGAAAVDLRLEADPSASARWFDPRTGYWSPAFAVSGTKGQMTFVAPSKDDWVLDIRQ